jgi:hypothetical protein
MNKEVRKIEVDHYPEIAEGLKDIFLSNLSNKDIKVSVTIGELSSALNTLIANGYSAGEKLIQYSRNVHRLHLDITVIVENPSNGNFEIIIFEIKKTKRMGLTELSQLIGYTLVSESRFGILMNVDNSVSGEFSVILDSDKNLTQIVRMIDSETTTHKLGVMVWNSNTKKIEYTQSGAIKTIPELISMIEESLK